MAKGSLKLNMKRDDARTLMLKMDARLTYAGRERKAGFKLEGQRELKHIEVTYQLVKADLNRAKMEIQRRFDFYQTLKAQNRDRRQKREIAWCEEEEREWERQARAARRCKLLPRLEAPKNHRAEAIGSIRRDQRREFAGKMAHEMHINRSLNALSDSYARHKTLTERNEARLGQIAQNGDPDESKTVKGKIKNTLLPVKLGDSQGGQNIPKTYDGLQTRSPSSEIPIKKVGAGNSSTTGSLNQMMSSGKVDEQTGKAESQGRPIAAGFDPKRPFYMDTSTYQQRHAGANQTDKPSVSMNRIRRRGVYQMDRPTAEGASGAPNCSRRQDPTAHTSKESKKQRTRSLTHAPQQIIPLRFYAVEENPFSKGDALPAINRSSDLVDADKADEMYEWLGFESQEEFEKLRQAGLVLEYDRENCSDTSSISGRNA